MSMAQSMTCRIHVLLVDHDINHHGPAIEILQYFSYKVTIVKLASVALSILSRGNPRFDLLMENINSPDLCGFKLLQEAVNMDLPVVLLLDEDDIVLTKRALEGGAFLCIKKPLTIETAKYLWQHVLREKVRKVKENERFKEFVMHNKLHDEFGEEDPMRGYINDYMNSDENYVSNKKVRYTKIANEDEETSPQHRDVAKFRKKVWTEWTQELHEKFMDAVRMLGEGRCYPREILELMNVPGLTRMQVASHLQKCRRGTWQSPDERKCKIVMPKMNLPQTSGRAKPRKFGSMPHIGQQDHDNIADFIFYSSMGNKMPGDNGEGNSYERYSNRFSQVGLETLNVAQIGLSLGMDDEAFMSNEQFVFDAQSVTPSINTSLDQKNTAEDYYEFPNIDCMIQNLSASQQEQKVESSGGQDAFDLNPVYSNQGPVLDATITTQGNEAAIANNGETEDQKREE
ncbi:two-component response regulator ARR14-like isoform X2 [Sesamum indicum]|uniref:Two-component response regulator ARR14-like isoform X2 n=1 Tax=Sesamum indicum TaxID=4182 RepID=A0A6I9TX62_SESIN|nr:two-component response regulator ARR14-like isoform X2 [Sesamum indicum]